MYITAFTWGDLILFLAWGLVCYLWGIAERKYKHCGYLPGGNYNGPPPKGLIRPTAPPSPPPLNNIMCPKCKIKLNTRDDALNHVIYCPECLYTPTEI